MDWLDLLAVQGTLKSLLQHHSSNASILRCSAFFTVQLSHPNMTTGKTIALTRQTFVGKVVCLLLNMLSRLVITFLPRSKHCPLCCLGINIGSLLVNFSIYASDQKVLWNVHKMSLKNSQGRITKTKLKAVNGETNIKPVYVFMPL